MKIQPTRLKEVIELFPSVYEDDRGAFFEGYNEKTFHDLGINDYFNQDNVSISLQGVLRGLHFQKEPFAQTKLVSVQVGKVFDVAVDLRSGSPTFGKWVGVYLSDEAHNMLYIPKGFAHGFYVVSPKAVFTYKCAGLYNKEADGGIRFDDPDVGIEWPITQVPRLSTKDSTLPSLATYLGRTAEV